MGGRRLWGDEQAALRRAIRNGEPAKEVCAKFQIDPSTYRQYRQLGHIKKKRATYADYLKALELRREGKRYKDISASCHVPISTLGNWFHKEKIRKKREYPAELKNKAFQLGKEGLTREQISKRLDVSLSTVKRWFVERARPHCIKQRGPSPSP